LVGFAVIETRIADTPTDGFRSDGGVRASKGSGGEMREGELMSRIRSLIFDFTGFAVDGARSADNSMDCFRVDGGVMDPALPDSSSVVLKIVALLLSQEFGAL
jgi:hypothetical protein